MGVGIKSEDIYVCVCIFQIYSILFYTFQIYSILMSSREHPSQKRHETMRQTKCLSQLTSAILNPMLAHSGHKNGGDKTRWQGGGHAENVHTSVDPTTGALKHHACQEQVPPQDGTIPPRYAQMQITLDPFHTGENSDSFLQKQTHILDMDVHLLLLWPQSTLSEDVRRF